MNWDALPRNGKWFIYEIADWKIFIMGFFMVCYARLWRNKSLIRELSLSPEVFELQSRFCLRYIFCWFIFLQLLEIIFDLVFASSLRILDNNPTIIYLVLESELSRKCSAWIWEEHRPILTVAIATIDYLVRLFTLMGSLILLAFSMAFFRKLSAWIYLPILFALFLLNKF